MTRAQPPLGHIMSIRVGGAIGVVNVCAGCGCVVGVVRIQVMNFNLLHYPLLCRVFKALFSGERFCISVSIAVRN